MKRLFWLIILLLLPFGLRAQDETLAINATSSPTEMDYTGGAGYVVVTDNSDASHVSTATDYERHRFMVENTSETWTSIDSVNVTYRHSGKNTKAVPHALDIFVSTDSTMGGEVDYADATIRDSTVSYSTAPDGGAWTSTDVDGLEVQFRTGNIDGGGEWRGYEIDVYVYGTIEGGSEPTKGRRRRVMK